MKKFTVEGSTSVGFSISGIVAENKEKAAEKAFELISNKLDFGFDGSGYAYGTVESFEKTANFIQEEK